MVVYLQYWSPLGCYLRLEILLSDSGIFEGGAIAWNNPWILNTLFLMYPLGGGWGSIGTNMLIFLQLYPSIWCPLETLAPSSEIWMRKGSHGVPDLSLRRGGEGVSLVTPPFLWPMEAKNSWFKRTWGVLLPSCCVVVQHPSWNLLSGGASWWGRIGFDLLLEYSEPGLDPPLEFELLLYLN